LIGQPSKHIVSWDNDGLEVIGYQPCPQQGKITSLKTRVSDPSWERICRHQETTTKTSSHEPTVIAREQQHASDPFLDDENMAPNRPFGAHNRILFVKSFRGVNNRDCGGDSCRFLEGTLIGVVAEGGAVCWPGVCDACAIGGTEAKGARSGTCCWRLESQPVSRLFMAGARIATGESIPGVAIAVISSLLPRVGFVPGYEFPKVPTDEDRLCPGGDPARRLAKNEDMFNRVLARDIAIVVSSKTVVRFSFTVIVANTHL